MAKQITQQKLDELKKLRSSLTSNASIDYTIGTIVHIKQVLADLDLTSAFSFSITTELNKLEIYRDKYSNFSTTTSIIDNAIDYYASQL
ncbi:hypothetical protein [Chryseobacterium takakiae]|jgi:hypothetical protein|uniref:Uncharacterized protein n=1 Tax=Chryseobacterium takakiae TaxID=1302685 RepID=A0A1M4ZFL7_9FLAO|nr:hypothetical protein [Chryseobacterium takakiae]SHF16748.1 hypothetical protein SAMN05444408_11012 [Chryseobacterium takakiae]